MLFQCGPAPVPDPLNAPGDLNVTGGLVVGGTTQVDDLVVSGDITANNAVNASDVNVGTLLDATAGSTLLAGASFPNPGAPALTSPALTTPNIVAGDPAAARTIGMTAAGVPRIFLSTGSIGVQDVVTADDHVSAVVQTTNATPANGASATLANGKTCLAELEVAAKGPAGIGKAWKMVASFQNVSGTVTQQGTTTTVHAQGNAGFGAATVAFVISGTSILVQVTGIAATTIDWRTSIRLIERA